MAVAYEACPPEGALWHEYADLFPWIEGDAFRDLVEDISKNGIHEPIVFHEGRVLDGRNRYMAARDLGIEYPRVEYTGNDPLGFVISLNLKRRHLTESQRAMVAAKLAKMYAAQDDGGYRSAAATERWSREREIKDIWASDASYDTKDALAGHLKEQWQRKDRTEFKRGTRNVYVAVSADRMKIGVSSFPAQRIESLRVGHPDIRLVETWEGSFGDERALHELLAVHGLGGEWFVYSTETFDAVVKYMQNRQLADVHISANLIAAKVMNVGERSVERANVVRDHGAPELISAVESGKVSVSAAADISSKPKDEQTEIVARGEREILNAAKAIRAEKATVRRTERLDKIAEISKGNAELSTDQHYPIIYADPPWRYENPPMGGTNRSIENHYPTMTLDEICAMPVGDLATDDAMLYLWATAPKLAECMQVIEAWGFEYRTNIVWDKEVIGMGYHARNQHEILLIAKRGNIPPPKAGKQPSSVHRERRTDHSAKPIFYYEMIEAAYPNLPKIELFCRQPRVGWSVWGNQSGAANAA